MRHPFISEYSRFVRISMIHLLGSMRSYLTEAPSHSGEGSLLPMHMSYSMTMLASPMAPMRRASPSLSNVNRSVSLWRSSNPTTSITILPCSLSISDLHFRNFRSLPRENTKSEHHLSSTGILESVGRRRRVLQVV